MAFTHMSGWGELILLISKLQLFKAHTLKPNRYFSLSNQFSNVVKINTETKQPLSPQQKTDYVNSRPQSLGWYNELKDEVKTLPKERKNDNVPRFRMR